MSHSSERTSLGHRMHLSGTCFSSWGQWAGLCREPFIRQVSLHQLCLAVGYSRAPGCLWGAGDGQGAGRAYSRQAAIHRRGVGTDIKCSRPEC